MRRFLTGLKAYGKAAGLVFKGSLWGPLLVPPLIGLLYFPLVGWLAFRYGAACAVYLRDHWLPESFHNGALVALIAITLWLGGAYAGFFLFRNVIMILYAP